MNAPESRFCSVVWHNRRSNGEVWYIKSPLGKNEIGRFLSTAEKNAGLKQEEKSVTNHSVIPVLLSIRAAK